MDDGLECSLADAQTMKRLAAAKPPIDCRVAWRWRAERAPAEYPRRAASVVDAARRLLEGIPLLPRTSLEADLAAADEVGIIFT